MFGPPASLLSPGPFSFPSVASTDAQKLIDAIRDQTSGTPPHMVYVIDIVSVRFGGYFTPQIKFQLQRFRYLQMLTLNDCGIVSLQNFPNLNSLIRLDMVFNSISGQQLQYLSGLRHLQTLMLGANKIEKIQNLNALKGMRNLLQLDLLNNEVVKLPGYRAQVFTMLPSISILDTLDKIGKDAYNNATMLEAVSRIPDNLFDKSPPPPPAPIHAPIHIKEKKKLKSALARTGSLDSISARPVVSAHLRPTKNSRAGKAGKSKAIIPAGKSRSSKAGLVFPIGRIKRKLKQVMVGQRVGVGSAIYMAAVLEYLSAELIEIAGNDAKNQHKKRITPLSIRRALKNDEQIQKLLKNVTIGCLGE